MSDLENINDELLSAYLDNELAPAERALVESRLASDPAARQTLEQLRSVTQSVRNLPNEPIGRDLRETILRRAVQTKAIEQATPQRAGASPPSTSKPLTTAATSTTSPIINFLSSRRWAWSVLALAATILLVIALPLFNNEPNLAPVAQNEKKAEAPAATRSFDHREALAKIPGASAGTTLADKVAPSSSPAPGSPSVPQGQVGGGYAFDARPEQEPAAVDRESDLGLRAKSEGAPVVANTQTAPAATPATVPPPTHAATSDSDPLAKYPLAAAPAAPSAPPAKQLEEREQHGSAVEGQGVLVVNVVAKRAAWQQKAFDELLRKNNVDFDTPTQLSDAPKEAAAGAAPAPVAGAPIASKSVAKEDNAASRAPARGSVSRFEEKLADDSSGEKNREDVEAVLVVAPSATITSCMDALDRDKANFVGVYVKPPETLRRDLAEAKRANAPAETDFTKYNRGRVPQQEAQRFAGANDYFTTLNDETHGFGIEPQSTAGFGGVVQQATDGPITLEAGTEGGGASRGRARKLVTNGRTDFQWYTKDNSGTLGRESSPTDAKLKFKVADSLKAAAAQNGEQLRVLFVLRPSDEPEPSLKAKNTPE